MLDITKTIDVQFTDTLEHRVAMAGHALRSVATELFKLSESAEARDLMIDDLGSYSEALLALNLVWSRIKAREEA